MKELYPAQARHLQALLEALRNNKSALSSSQTGTGKTVVACHLARSLPNYNIGVVCPKGAILHWERHLEEHGISPLFVLNYEALRTGNRDKFLTKAGTKLFHWKLSPETILIWDEVHKCKGNGTQNSQMLIAARKQGIPLLLLSATAAKDPTEMRALGYALGLHDLNRGLGSGMGWVDWMNQLGCWKDNWGRWHPGSTGSLRALHSEMYEKRRCADRIGVRDMPEAFRNNSVDMHLVDVDPSVLQAYEESGVTSEMIDHVLGEIHQRKLGDRNPDNPLTRILRARQVAEANKIRVFEDEARDRLDEGFSVVIFVEFVESLKALRSLFPDSGVICGAFNGHRQMASDRNRTIDAFANDELRMVISTISAGGTSINLHDQTGKHPRFALISPPFSLINYEQCLGRIYRTNAKSDSVQRVLVAAGTIEEYVMQVLEHKRKQLRDLHQPDEQS